MSPAYGLSLAEVAALEATGHADAEVRLWHRWQHHQDDQARQQLIELHMPYARTLAALAYARRPNDSVEFEEYLQLAHVGLIESVDRYRPDYGASFKTYAAHRMRGAILDGLPSQTEAHQQYTQEKKAVLATRRADLHSRGIGQERSDNDASSEAQVPPKQPEPAWLPTEEVDSQVRESLAWIANLGVGIALGLLLEETGMYWSSDQEPMCQNLSPEQAYQEQQQHQHWQQVLTHQVNALPEAEAFVIRYHYFQQVSFERIAFMLDLSRARISQLHRQGLSRLQNALACKRCDLLW